jgi:hypothetical protein
MWSVELLWVMIGGLDGEMRRKVGILQVLS